MGDLSTPRPQIPLAARRASAVERTRQLLNRVLAVGRQAVAHVDNVPSFARFARTLAQAGLTPRTVIDIGVAYGTPWLYEAYPGAKFHLVDPTREALPHMREWATRLDAEVHNLALGTAPGTMTIATRATIEHASLLDVADDAAIRDRYTVEVARFDALFTTLERSVLCKIDVEGAELMVLQGMTGKLREIDVIIVETSMNSLYDNGVAFADIVAFCRDAGFSFADFVGLCRRPYDGALHQIDAVFIPDDSPLRVKRWT